MHLSHQHDEEKDPYQVPTTIKPVLLGDFRSDLLPLEAWSRPLLEIQDFRWVPHEEHGYVPEFATFNDGHNFGPITFGYLKRRFGEATERDVESLRFELGEEPA